MANYVIIEYDTTRPVAEIFAPNYTTDEIMNIITIESNEDLSTYQEFYAIDSAGQRHDYTFEKEDGNTYTGKIRFNTMSHGIITFYARVKDEVGNISNLISKTINVRENIILLSLDVNVKERRMEVSENPFMEISIDSSSQEAIIDIEEQNINISDESRKIENTIREIQEKDTVY